MPSQDAIIRAEARRELDRRRAGPHAAKLADAMRQWARKPSPKRTQEAAFMASSTPHVFDRKLDSLEDYAVEGYNAVEALGPGEAGAEIVGLLMALEEMQRS